MIAFDSRDFPKPFFADDALSLQSPGSLFKRHFTARRNALPSLCFSEIDQAFLVWGALTVVIFAIAQFSAMSWATQAVLDAALTGAGIACTSRLTWDIASLARLRWVVLLWAGLMTVGSVVTAYGIFCGNALILTRLCSLWLGLCAVGYGTMAISMKSRCFTAACWMHVGAIAAIIYTPGYTSNWQFFITGLVIASTLFFFSVVPWDREEP